MEIDKLINILKDGRTKNVQGDIIHFFQNRPLKFLWR